MDTKTAQDAFDKVCLHLRTQGCPSPSHYAPETVGSFRGPGRLMDAVGCLVPDDEYRDELEDGTPQDWTSTRALSVPSLRKYSAEFLDRLVTVHDDSLDPTCTPGYVIEKGLTDIAQEFGLESREVHGFVGWGAK